MTISLIIAITISFVILLTITVVKIDKFTLNSNINLISPTEAYEILSGNIQYFSQMSEIDWKARNTTMNEYTKLIKEAVTIPQWYNLSMIHDNITRDIKQIVNIVKTSDTFKNLPWFDVHKFTNMDWSIIYVKGTDYENGFHHALDKHIVLNIDRIIPIETIFHEQIHVYQRKYPELYEIYVEDNSFREVYEISSHPMNAANPDNPTGKIYEHDGKLAQTRYVNECNPDMDETNSCSHKCEPYERQAYLMEEKLLLNTIKL